MATGQPAKAMTEVTLIEKRTVAGTNALVDGPTHRAFTNASGEFVFYRDLTGPATLLVRDIAREINELSVQKNELTLMLK